METLNRRQFVAAAASAAAACACAVCPNQLAHAAQARSAPVDIGKPADFPADGLWDNWLRQGFFVARREKRLYAMLAECSHRGGRLAQDRNEKGRLICTKHKGLFDAEGTPTGGPPTDPLVRLGISLKEGRIIVDPSTQFGAAHLDDAGAFISVE